MIIIKPFFLVLSLLFGSAAETATCRSERMALPANRVANVLEQEVFPVLVALDSLLLDSTQKDEHEKPSGELRLRVGNESNQVDGVFGPFTYGLEGHYTFTNGMGIEAAMIRLHEPGSPTFNSFLDEGQLSLKLPEITFLQQRLAFTATIWSNRMIDMYTNVGGIEVADKWETLAVNLGLYAGAAVRDEVSGRFLGGRLGISHVFGPIELALEQMTGVIRTAGDLNSLGGGVYQKTSLEANAEVNLSNSLPLTLTFSVEKRYFDFGNGGPAIDPLDSYILVLGVEINIVGLLSSRN